MIRFEGVNKVFGDGTVAVADLDLELPAGRISVLVGPSGCGKTTSLRMVNRLVTPTSGRVLLDGRDVATQDETTLRRHIGYVIQHAGLFPHRTVLDNIATVPRLLGVSRPEARRRALELIERVGLPAALAGRYPASLSGGQQQRVGVARALAADPPVMLMDEPFSAVDPVVRGALQQELLRLQRELGTTIALVTHDIDEAVTLGDEVAVFREGGHLAQVGTPEDLLTAPADDFVASFVGRDRGWRSLSFLPAGELTPRPVPADLTPSPSRIFTTLKPGRPPRSADSRNESPDTPGGVTLPVGFGVMRSHQARPLHRFLLIAPVKGSLKWVGDNRGQSGPLRMRSRSNFETSLLRQEWQDISPDRHEGVQLRKAAVVESSGWTVYVADAYLDVTHMALPDIEEALSLAAEAGCLRALNERPMWVSRSLVGNSIHGWTDRDAIEVKTGEREDYLILGWGNNVISPSLNDDFDTWQNAVRGLVDAQALWCRLDAVSSRAAGELGLLVALRGQRAQLDSLPDNGADEMTRQLILFDLSQDELLTRVQGIRRFAAIEQLKAWGVEELRARTERRVEDLRKLAEEATRRRLRRYQALVEGILFALALTSLVQMVLAFVQAAFGGGATAIPGGSRGLLQWVRDADIDLLIGSTTLILIGAALAVATARRLTR